MSNLVFWYPINETELVMIEVKEFFFKLSMYDTNKNLKEANNLT